MDLIFKFQKVFIETLSNENADGLFCKEIGFHQAYCMSPTPIVFYFHIRKTQVDAYRGSILFL